VVIRVLFLYVSLFAHTLILYLKKTLHYYYPLLNQPNVHSEDAYKYTTVKWQLLRLVDYQIFSPPLVSQLMQMESGLTNIQNLEIWSNECNDDYFIQLLDRLSSVDYQSSCFSFTGSPYSSFLEMGGPSSHQYQYHVAAIEVMTIGSSNWKLTRHQIESYPSEIGTLIAQLPCIFYNVLFETINNILPSLLTGNSSLFSPLHGHLSILSPVHSSVSSIKIPLMQYVTMFHAFFRYKGSTAIWQYVVFVKRIAELNGVKSIAMLYLLCKLVAPFVINIIQHKEAGSLVLAFYDCLHLIDISHIYDDTHQAEQDTYLLDTILQFLQQISSEASKIPAAVRLQLQKKLHTLPTMQVFLKKNTTKEHVINPLIKCLGFASFRKP